MMGQKYFKEGATSIRLKDRKNTIYNKINNNLKNFFLGGRARLL